MQFTLTFKKKIEFLDAAVNERKPNKIMINVELHFKLKKFSN